MGHRSPFTPILVLALVIGALLGPGATSASADPLEIATQDDGVLFYRKYLSSQTAFDRMAALHVNYLRVNVNWLFALKPADQNRSTPPANPAWDFAFTDRIVSDATAHGIKVQFTLTGPAPGWATEDGRIGTRNPSEGQFARFAAAVANRYRGRVKRYAIWNEPNQPGWLTPQTRCKVSFGAGFVRVRGHRQHRKIFKCKDLSPSRYRRLYARGRAAIKAVDPSNEVWIGELAPVGRKFRTDSALAPRSFLREVLCVDKRYTRSSCSGLKADGVAHHPYPLSAKKQEAPDWPGLTSQDITLASYSRLRRDLERYQVMGALSTDDGAVPPVFYTEMGYQTGGPRAIDETTQAQYLRTSLQMAAKQPGVRQFLFYTLYDEAPGRKWIAGLFRNNGSTKPAFTSMVDAINAGENRP